MQKPAAGAIAIALLPFFGMCFTVSLWDRATPLIFGLPFNMAWLLGWIILSSGCLAIAHRIQTNAEKRSR